MYTYLQTTVSTTDTNSYTFSAQNLGAASADRRIIVAIASRKAGATTTITGVSVAGIAAADIKQVTNTVTNTGVVGIATVDVPAGTSGDIVVTFGATMARCVISVYAATGLVSSIPVDSLTTTGTDPSGVLDIPAGGFAIGIGNAGASGSVTWTGLTERVDAVAESTMNYTVADANFALAQTNLAIAIDFTLSTEGTLVAASWEVDATSPIKKYQTVSQANIKKVMGIAIANIKKILTVTK